MNKTVKGLLFIWLGLGFAVSSFFYLYADKKVVDKKDFKSDMRYYEAKNKHITKFRNYSKIASVTTISSAFLILSIGVFTSKKKGDK